MSRPIKPLAVALALLLAACAGTGEAPPETAAAPDAAATPAEAPSASAGATATAGAATVAAGPDLQAQPEAATGWQAKPPGVAQKYMVAAAHPLAAQAGQAMLKRGGAAIDAAIATQAVLTLVEPQSSGIGGGAFLLHWDSDSRRLSAWDGRETAPAAARPERFLDADGKPLPFNDAVVGGLSVGVPGVLRMLEAVHKREGRLPWATLFEPAIKLAEDGFAVTPRLHQLLAEDQDLRKMPAAAAYFYGDDGEPPAVGETLRNPALAATFRTIARGGADAFYRGPLAAAMVEAVRTAPRRPGDLSLADLSGYQAKEREPVCTGYRGRLVCGMGPPSSGGIAVGQILGMLDTLPPALVNEPLGIRTAHYLTQAQRLAFADRNLYVGDSDFVDVPVAGLIDKGYLRERARLMRADGLIASPEAGTPPGVPQKTAAWGNGAALEIPSTTQVSIVDSHGDALSMTSSIEGAFGSRVFVNGFLLNNQLTDFSFEPKDAKGRPVANRVEPGKRPRSSMAPTIVLGQNLRPLLVTGSPGGARIIGYTAGSIMGVLDWGLDPQEAVSLPHVQSRGGATELEAGTAAERLAPDLQARGHEVKIVDMTSGLHAIAIGPDGRLYGGADPRREGVALGE